jgi:hypothetical protein
MMEKQRRALAPEELDRQDARALPDREEMSVINPELGPVKVVPIYRDPMVPADPPPELSPVPEPPTVQ